MYPMLEHPEIGHIERTGYPSHIKDTDLDVDDDVQEIEDLGGYHNEDTIYEERREEAYGW